MCAKKVQLFMANFGIIRMQKINNLGGLTGIAKHNTRADREMKSLQHIKGNKKPQLLFGSGDYKDEYFKSIKDHTVNGHEPSIQKRCNYGWDIVTTFTNSEGINLSQWYEANRNWMNQTFGKTNVRMCVAHFDETTPHLHWFVTPFHPNEKRDRYISGTSYWTDGKDKMRKLQDSYYEGVSKQFGLDRGDLNKHDKHIQPSVHREQSSKARRSFMEWFSSQPLEKQKEWAWKAQQRLDELAKAGQQESSAFKYFSDSLEQVRKSQPDLLVRVTSILLNDGAETKIHKLPSITTTSSFGQPKIDSSKLQQNEFCLGLMIGGIFALGFSQIQEQKPPQEMSLLDYLVKVLDLDMEEAQKIIANRKRNTSGYVAE